MSVSKLLRERVTAHSAKRGAEIFAKPDFQEGDVVISGFMLEGWKNFSRKRLMKTMYLQLVVKVHPGWTESDGRVTCWKLDSRWFRPGKLGVVHRGGPAEGYVKVTEAIGKDFVNLVLKSEEFGI
jgi:hypothetical protein